MAAPDLSVDRYANQYFNGDYRPIGLAAGGTSPILSPMDATLPPDYEYSLSFGEGRGEGGNIVRHYQSTIADGFRTAGLVGEYDQLNRLRFGTNAFYGTADASSLSLTEALEAPTYDGNGNIRTLDRCYSSTTEQRHRNRLNYGYADGTNLLTSVAADVNGAAINEDYLPYDLLRGTTTYTYDRSGNLVREQSDKAASATLIDWNAYGKVTTVASPTGTTTFGYGPDQNRWRKDFGPRGTTYYIRDAQGSTLATYERGSDSLAELTWKQQYLFGSSRLGEVVMDRSLPVGAVNPFNYGRRQYELTNHLGNVTTVFGENAVAYEDSQDGMTYTAPDLVSYRDYLAFGLGLDRGASVLGKQGYRYAFNGKEVDDQGEWGSSGSNGQSNSMYDYGFRIYNPGIARFLSVDPLSPDYPMLTPYQFASNTPIWAIDMDGLEAYVESGILYYEVQAGQGPTQIAADLNSAESKKREGYSLIRPLHWTQLVDQPQNNAAYFSHITNGRYNRHNEEYRTLNMNEGDIINVTELLHRQERLPGPDLSIDLNSSDDKKTFLSTMKLMRNFNSWYRMNNPERQNSFFERGRYNMSSFLSNTADHQRGHLFEYWGGETQGYKFQVFERGLDLGRDDLIQVSFNIIQGDYMESTEALSDEANAFFIRGGGHSQDGYSRHIYMEFGQDTSLYNQAAKFINGEISSKEFLLSIDD